METLGQLGMGVELAVGGGDVAVFEKIGETPPAGRHGELEFVGLERQRPALGGVGEALLEVVRPPLRVASAVDGQGERRRIAQPPGHRHRFLAELESATVEIRPVESHRQPAQEAHAHRRIARRQCSDRLFEEGDEGLVATSAEVVAGDPGVADRRARQAIAETQLTGERCGFEVGAPPDRRVAAAGPRRAEGQQQITPPVRIVVARRHQRVESAAEVCRRLVVGGLGERPLAGSGGVVDRSAGVTPRTCRQQEVMRELGEVRIGITSVDLLERAADAPVQLRPPTRFELAVQGVADKNVLEGERADNAAARSDRPAVDGIIKEVEQSVLLPTDHHAEHRQREGATDDGGDAQQGAGLLVEVGQPCSRRVTHARWQRQGVRAPGVSRRAIPAG